MNLSPSPFEAIKSGSKTVELRLYDAKRRRLSVGDEILFTNCSSKEQTKRKIEGLRVFSDFFELYSHYDPVSIGYNDGKTADPNDMYLYYSKEEIDQCGVIAIELEHSLNRDTKAKLLLGERSETTVRIYFERAQDTMIKKVLPQKAQTVEEALRDYRETLLPGAKSFGKTILVDGKYIGDIWCYGIDKDDEPNAMLSYCIFDRSYWSQGIATEAVSLFLEEVKRKYALQTIGAFTFSDHIASIKVLKKNGFSWLEEFTENGRKSSYFQYRF